MTFQGPLTALGIESVPVSTRFGSESKNQDGLLVISVVPESVAATGNVREGDVIELIDGQPAMHGIAVGSQKEAGIGSDVVCSLSGLKITNTHPMILQRQLNLFG